METNLTEVKSDYYNKIFHKKQRDILLFSDIIIPKNMPIILRQDWTDDKFAPTQWINTCDEITSTQNYIIWSIIANANNIEYFMIKCNIYWFTP